jgi:membrane protease YdiL (CAAX protease family)
MMTTIKAFIKNHPVLAYFVLTFAISWGGVLILGAPYGMPTASQQFEKVWPIVFIPYFLGPSTAGLLLTALVHGRAGFRELLSRMLKWRVSVRWYAVALLTAPLLVTPTLLALSLTSPAYLPAIVTTANKVTLILSGIAIGLFFGGILEELGWTGFAIPGLRRRYGVFTTGLIVGLLWGVWHFLPTFWGSGDPSGVFSPLLFLPPCLFYVGVLPACRVLMVWVFDRTGSQFVMMLMHMSITASTLFILSPSARGVPLMMYYLILTAVVWLVVAAVALASRGQLWRQPRLARV